MFLQNFSSSKSFEGIYHDNSSSSRVVNVDLTRSRWQNCVKAEFCEVHKASPDQFNMHTRSTIVFRITLLFSNYSNSCIFIFFLVFPSNLQDCVLISRSTICMSRWMRWWCFVLIAWILRLYPCSPWCSMIITVDTWYILRDNVLFKEEAKLVLQNFASTRHLSFLFLFLASQDSFLNAF